jgi:hypothetical protein
MVVEFRSQAAAFPANDAVVEYPDDTGIPTSYHARYELYIPQATFDINDTTFPIVLATGSASYLYIQIVDGEWFWRAFRSSTGTTEAVPVIPDQWNYLEVIVVGTGTTRSVEYKVNDVSLRVFSGGPVAYNVFQLNWWVGFGVFNQGSSFPPSTVYYYGRQFKIGSNLGGSDLLYFQGDLDVFSPSNNNWQSGPGNVSVVEFPF